MIGLIDCNNFFVSCERVFNPRLWKRPVIVLSNGGGCVVARSNEVKELGIKMSQPFFQIENLVKKNKVAVLTSNFELYSDMSKRVMSTIEQLVPDMTQYSIDEAFIDLADMDEKS